MVVQYKGSPRYICNYLRQQYRVPVCQYLPTDPIDARVVEAFFVALSPVEVDLYARTMASWRQADEATRRAQASQVERLRYQAALAERQFMQVDPDNRLVAAELERRWETALRALRQAEDTYAQAPSPTSAPELPEELKAALTDLGQHLPALWESPTLTQARKKALLRCLIDKVVLHRSARDTVAVRIVWKGGDTTSLAIPISVGSLAEYSKAQALESRVLALCDEGVSDAAIATMLTREGFRSPLHEQVLASTVKGLRLRHRRLREPHQSHPRKIAGYLTVPQLAQRLAIPKHWIYDRIHNGTIAITCDPVTGLYLFPDAPATLDQFRQFRAGVLHQLRY
jgi:hypothetical protein